NQLKKGQRSASHRAHTVYHPSLVSHHLGIAVPTRAASSRREPPRFPLRLLFQTSHAGPRSRAMASETENPQRHKGSQDQGQRGSGTGRQKAALLPTKRTRLRLGPARAPKPRSIDAVDGAKPETAVDEMAATRQRCFRLRPALSRASTPSP